MCLYICRKHALWLHLNEITSADTRKVIKENNDSFVSVFWSLYWCILSLIMHFSYYMICVWVRPFLSISPISLFLSPSFSISFQLFFQHRRSLSSYAHSFHSRFIASFFPAFLRSLSLSTIRSQLYSTHLYFSLFLCCLHRLYFVCSHHIGWLT